MNTTNLASARLGAQATACSDDFFADKARLIQDTAPVFLPDRYDDHGKWMDGWESRRRRSIGHDWCVIKLAVPGRLQRFDVDTTHFTGNYPPGARIEGAGTDTCPEPDSSAWRALTPMLALTGDNRHHADCLDGDTVYRWIRLVIYPDGGVARLRAWGQPHIDIGASDRAELSALIHGGRIVGYSDAHFGNVEAVLTAGRGADMGDGWETARRRVPGNEWLVIALGAAGVIDEIEIDTAHFKGNYPAGVSVQLPTVIIHRHPEFWDRPDEFRPERFDPSASEGRSRYAYMPFSLGPRICIGKHLALYESKLQERSSPFSAA